MPTTASRSEETKATFICRECGHESPVRGDWNVSEPGAPGERRVYECPDCEAVVVAQPVFEIPA